MRMLPDSQLRILISGMPDFLESLLLVKFKRDRRMALSLAPKSFILKSVANISPYFYNQKFILK